MRRGVKVDTNLNETIIKIGCSMFKLTDRQLDLLEGPFMLIARPILATLGIIVVSSWLFLDIGIPAIVRLVKND